MFRHSIAYTLKLGATFNLRAPNHCCTLVCSIADMARWTMVQHERHNTDRTARWLSPERERELDPFNVINYMPIDPFDKVADIGCGPGYFTIPLAKHLVYGRLYAIDTDEEMVEITQQRVNTARLGNVQVRSLPAHSVPHRSRAHWMAPSCR